MTWLSYTWTHLILFGLWSPFIHIHIEALACQAKSGHGTSWTSSNDDNFPSPVNAGDLSVCRAMRHPGAAKRAAALHIQPCLLLQDEERDASAQREGYSKREDGFGLTLLPELVCLDSAFRQVTSRNKLGSPQSFAVSGQEHHGHLAVLASVKIVHPQLSRN